MTHSTDDSQAATEWLAHLLSRAAAQHEPSAIASISRAGPTTVAVRTADGDLVSISVAAYVDNAIAHRRAVLRAPSRHNDQHPLPVAGPAVSG